ncbi:MAG: hypothetical protein HQ465_11280, partial [Rhodospirillales bacterium]|nr:hypothetical protein [Rhodospirillales bacterium]
FSLYFPSMLKPVPIRLRAGLWMIARNRETIPPLPAEGRTSMDLPRDAERDFYAVIGYLPLGDHAIRADMVERLAAMARAAVRESRETSRRSQQQEKQEKKPVAEASGAAPAIPAPATVDEISEWAIVAAAFGENEPAPAAEPTAAPEAAAAAEPIPEPAPELAPELAAEPAGEPAGADPVATDPVAEAPAEATPVAETAPTEEPAAEPGAAESATELAAEHAAPSAEGTAPQEESKPAKKEPRPLLPGWFRATPQMMSLVGCSEPEMANVLRGLGYRVHPPSEENGPLYAFSIKPRFVREREEQRERQRLQEREQRQQREQRRRDRPERPNERQFFADTPRPPRGKDERPRSEAPRPEGARPEGAQPGGQRPEGQRQDRGPGGNKDGRAPHDNRGRDDRRGPRPPRRDNGGPALRLYATTETKGDPAADSPFAKLLELKLGGKK